jgi:hypothetical protein
MMTDYQAELNQRYWAYQRSQFRGWEQFLEQPYAPGRRPPVFLAHQVRHNLLVDMAAGRDEAGRLRALLPPGTMHRWFRSMNSSQALTVSVFGNLMRYDCLQVLAELTDEGGEPLFGRAEIASDDFRLEVTVNTLGEPRPTSLDACISGRPRVAIEVKFTEHQIGRCSRPGLEPSASNYDTDLCDGTYSRQRGRRERCALTENGIHYWRYVPDLFRWRADVDHGPCPLYGNYQLVRNLLAAGVGPDGTASVADGRVVLIYDERNPAFRPGGKALASYVETRAALREPAMLQRCSWQRITEAVRGRGVLPWLTEQLAAKYGL